MIPHSNCFFGTLGYPTKLLTESKIKKLKKKPSQVLVDGKNIPLMKNYNMKKNKVAQTDEVSSATAIVNYILNRFMPFVFVFGILFYINAFEMWVSYLILPLVWFISTYSFKCGVAHVLSGFHGLEEFEIEIRDNDKKE